MLLRIHLIRGTVAGGFQKGAYYCFGMARLLYCPNPLPQPLKRWPDPGSVATKTFLGSTCTENFR